MVWLNSAFNTDSCRMHRVFGDESTGEGFIHRRANSR
jgi:hypothetical protein